MNTMRGKKRRERKEVGVRGSCEVNVQHFKLTGISLENEPLATHL